MIKLSASSIIDFLQCSKKFEFRMTKSEEGIDTEEQAIGNFIHKVIEEDIGVELNSEHVIDQLRNFNIQDIDKAMRYLQNFIELRPQLDITETDLTEYYFREKISADIQISGKMDRVNTEHNVVYDWKASTSKKKYLSNDVQCIVYYSMYNRIFGRYPSVFLVNLHFKELRPFIPNKRYINTLFNVVIPKIALEVSEKQFYKTGYFTSSCFNCPYLGVCSLEE